MLLPRLDTAHVFVLTSALATLGIPWVALDPSKPGAIRQAQIELLSAHMRVTDRDSDDINLHLFGTGETVPMSQVPFLK